MDINEYKWLLWLIAHLQKNGKEVPKYLWDRLHFLEKDSSTDDGKAEGMFEWKWNGCMFCPEALDEFLTTVRFWSADPPALKFCNGEATERKKCLVSRPLFVVVHEELVNEDYFGGYGHFTSFTESFYDDTGIFKEKILKVTRSNCRKEDIWKLPRHERGILRKILDWLYNRRQNHNCDDFR